MKKRLKLGDIYGFQYFEEKRIYKLICGNRKRIKNNGLPECFRFNSYSEWKNYVWSKYEKCNCQQLNNFLHFLQMQLRKIKPAQQFRDLIYVPIMVALITQMIAEMPSLKNQEIEINTSVTAKVAFIFVVIIAIFSIFIFVRDMLYSFNSKSEDKDMYEDYISIIQEIIQSKENEEK